MTGAIAAVASATIAAGGGGGSVAITNQTISKFRKISNGVAVAGYTITSAGNVTNQATTVLETWLHSGTASSYDVMATLISGVALEGTTGTWLNCGSNQTWNLSNSAGDDSTLSSQFLVQIRLSASGAVQTSATITLNSTSGSGI